MEMTTIAGCLLKQGQQIERSKGYVGTLGFYKTGWCTKPK